MAAPLTKTYGRFRTIQLGKRPLRRQCHHMNSQVRLGICLGLSLMQPLRLQAEQTHSEKRLVAMTVAVCNKAHVDATILSAAEYRASGIFRPAGVAVQWVGTGDCSTVPHGSHIAVVILSEAPVGWTSKDAMGLAPSRTGDYRRAYVFYDRVQDFVEARVDRNSHVVGLFIVLGHVIAHEIGHLLIPGDAHASSGIMRGRWRYSDWISAASGRLLFTPDQVRSIRKACSEAANRQMPAYQE